MNRNRTDPTATVDHKHAPAKSTKTPAAARPTARVDAAKTATNKAKPTPAPEAVPPAGGSWPDLSRPEEMADHKARLRGIDFECRALRDGYEKAARALWQAQDSYARLTQAKRWMEKNSVNDNWQMVAVDDKGNADEKEIIGHTEIAKIENGILKAAADSAESMYTRLCNLAEAVALSMKDALIDCHVIRYPAPRLHAERTMDWQAFTRDIDKLQIETVRVAAGLPASRTSGVTDPSPPQRQPLVGLQVNVMEILNAHATYGQNGEPTDCQSGNQIADVLAGTGFNNQTDKTVAETIAAMRNKGWTILNQRGAGYYLPCPELTRN